MKSFNEWLKGRVISENDPDYQEPSFSRILGEDGDDPFIVEVDVDEGHWTVSGPLWSLEYVLNGSEPKAGNPVQEKQGASPNLPSAWRRAGVMFSTPGKRLENLPPALKMVATTWIDKQVEWYIQNYKEEDPRDYDDHEPYNPDPDGYGWEDNYWKHGPGRDH
jgi:hypothetical protein